MNPAQLPDLAVLDAVGSLLGRELAARDARIKACEDRPLPERGERGEPGEPGPAGADGQEGPAGPAGEALRGEPGERGAPGEQGLSGPAGEPGAKGEAGEPGAPGEPGRAGEPGPQGERGADGLQGPAGAPGEPGAPGSPGERGEAGQQGAEGPAGPAGAPGQDGAPGRDGADGAGIEARAWEAGVHREGVVVSHHIGQFYRARKDTASEPPGEDWGRVGNAGFRLAGGYAEGREYLDGDLFVRDYGLFVQQRGEAHLWAGRGAKGDPGPRGIPGQDGKGGRDGRDGASIEALELREHKLVLVQRSAAGLADHALDLMPLLEAMLDAFAQRLQAVEDRIAAQVEERIARALAPPPPKGRNGSGRSAAS